MSAADALPDHVAENRRHWDDMAAQWVAQGERNWAITEPEWGMWNIPNRELPLRRRGASVYAIDNSDKQLTTARRLAAEHGVDDIEWVQGNAEAVEQPGGRLVFLGNHPLGMVCSPVSGDAPAGLTLERDYFGLERLDWTEAVDDPGGIEFNMEISSWLRLFRTTGFDVVDYIEIQAPSSAQGIRYWVDADWAKRFPSEQAWVLQKR